MKKLTTILALVAGSPVPRLPHAPTPPPTPVSVELADTVMRTFIEGIRQKDFRVLGSVASLNFRKSTPPEQVNEAFKAFFAVEITGDPLAGRSPVFLAAPAIGKDGRLAIQGMYELPDGLLLFQLAYVREGTGWKLDGLNVKSKPYNAPSAKPATEKPLKFRSQRGRWWRREFYPPRFPNVLNLNAFSRMNPSASF